MDKDREGNGRWIVLAVGSVGVLMVLTLLVRSGVGATEQPTPMPTPMPTPTTTPIATATPVATSTPQANLPLDVDRAFSNLHDLAAGTDPADARQYLVVERYQQVKGMALRSGVPVHFVEESKRFSREQAFLAAKAAWEDALWQAQVSRTDKPAVTYYATVLRNAGRNFAAKGATEDLRANGLSLLVACQRIVEKADLPLDECASDLRELLGDRLPPSPAPSPLL